jgi:hypothetical protein
VTICSAVFFWEAKKEIIDDRSFSVTHRQWFGNSLEPSDVHQSLPKRLRELTVRNLLFRGSEKTWGFVIRHIVPGLITPLGIHPLDVHRKRCRGVAAQNVDVDVVDRKIDKDVERLHATGFSYNLPIKCQSVRLKQTEASLVVLAPYFGKHVS